MGDAAVSALIFAETFLVERRGILVKIFEEIEVKNVVFDHIRTLNVVSEISLFDQNTLILNFGILL